MFYEISDPKTYHVALYIRLSKEDDNEGPSESVTNQKSLLDGFVQEYQLSVFDTYIDDGWSGTSFDRPAFQRMIEDIQAKRVNMVITKDLSRLGRDYIAVGQYIEFFFPENRVRYIAMTDGIDTGSDTAANDLTPFKAVMNDMYAKDISKKIKSVKHDKQRKGQFIGGKPVYGYKMHPTEKNKIVIDDVVAPMVRRIFGMALDGMSCRQIAVQLNAEGVLTPAAYAGIPISRPGPYSGLWSSERVSDMLQNETYIGNMVQGKTVKVSYKSKKCFKQERSNWIIVENTHEPIITRDEFDRVQMMLHSRRRTRCRTYDFLLKGMIFCHECGHPLAVINRKNTAGEDVLYFVCRTYQRFTKSGVCTSHTIKEKTVTDAVLAKVREVCEAYIHPNELLPIAREGIKVFQNNGDREQEYKAILSQLDVIKANIDHAYMDKLNGILTDEDFDRIYRRLKSERALLEDRLRPYEMPRMTPQKEEDIAQILVQRYADSALASRELLVSLIERVELTADKQVIIKFRFPQLQNVG